MKDMKEEQEAFRIIIMKPLQLLKPAILLKSQ